MRRQPTVLGRAGRQATALGGLLLGLFWAPLTQAAGEAVCARVKIEIEQEATLERQAFDARMRITNGLPDTALTNVAVEVSFADEAGTPVLASSDPGSTQALFFLRIASLSGIDEVNGAGTVAASAAAEIHWLIIPAPGAANGLENGALYTVGARLRYSSSGRESVIEVSPDYIFVKPMPELTLDYFLPKEVYGDDAFTPAIEPPVPFSLGVRARNDGAGPARNLAIESGQPKIVENEQGLLIGFVITGSEVNGVATAASLSTAFGDLPAHAAAAARWTMECTLSGKFVSFDAEFSHADELGGTLTSLIQAVNTHFLVRDVLVDLPGRDAVRDFLARDGDVYRLYESNGVDTEVLEQSAQATLRLTGTRTAALTFPATAGPAFVKLPDPFAGASVVTGAVRADGKRLDPANVWLSASRREDHTWEHFVNLFDVNTSGDYTLSFDSPAAVPQPPVVEYIPDRSRFETEPLSFLVMTSDPNGTLPRLSTGALPSGATFVDRGDGSGVFEWTPAHGQAGTYRVTFTASDGVLTASRTATLTVTAGGDGDGLDDAWELQYFGDLSQGPDDDYDGDTESNLTEFVNGTNPADARSTADPAHAYSAFEFEIWRGAAQSGEGSFTTDQWGGTLVCRPKAAETLVSGSLDKPSGSAGPSSVALLVAPGGSAASYRQDTYATEAALRADLVAGTYRVALQADRGAAGTYTLRFRLEVPAYAATDFPGYVPIESPAPGATNAALDPRLDLGTATWDWLQIETAAAHAPVYVHYRDAGDVPADQHQVPGGILADGLTYVLRVHAGAGHETWLGSVSRSTFTVHPLVPDGTFVATVDAADRGWWDLSGAYAAILVAGRPLVLALVHDPTGKLSGTATYTVATDTRVALSVRGSVRGASGSITMKGALQGADPARNVSVALTLNLTVGTAKRQLSGRLAGSVSVDSTAVPVDDPVILDIPEPMDGTWSLQFDLDQAGKQVTGTASLKLSNGVVHTFVAAGKAGAGNLAVLSLAGDPADAAAKAIRIRVTVTPLAGGRARLESFSGRGYGQTVGW